MVRKETRRANGEGTICQRKDGNFRGKILIGKNENGKPRYKCFDGKTRQIVADKMAKYRLDLAMGFAGERIPTLEEYAKHWLEDVKKVALKPTSYDRLESTFTTHILPQLGSTQLDKLTAQQIQRDLINVMQRKSLSHSSIKKAYDGINAVCEYAFIDGKIQRNPVALVQMPSKAETKQKQIVWFDKAEREAIIAACKMEYGNGNRRYIFGSAYILCMYTGLRMSEMLALRWDQVDWEKRRITVTDTALLVKDREHAKQDGSIPRVLEIQKSTKTATRRDVPLNPIAYEALKDLKKYTPYEEHGYVVCVHAGQCVLPDHFEKTFGKILDRAGVKHAGVHALRHTFATLLFEQCMEAHVIANLMGHASTNVTYKTYIHFTKRLMQDAAKQLNEIA